MEKEGGVRKICLLPSLPSDQIISKWKMRLISKPVEVESVPEVAFDFDDQQWVSVTNDTVMGSQLSRGQTAVFRATLDLSDPDIRSGRTGLFLSQIGDYGWIFINGKKVGESYTKIHSHLFEMAGRLHAGSNSVAIVVSAVDEIAPGGLGLVKLTWPQSAGIRPDAALDNSDQTAGLAGQWCGTLLDESGWQQRTIPDSSPSTAPSLLIWQRLSFHLLCVSPKKWVPWMVRLHAFGEGFIYLNGHALGRYQPTGQHHYYLPECWLNFEPNGQNVIVL